MILHERSAAVFINGYQKLLLEIYGPAGGNVKLLERLAKGRKKLMSDVSLLDNAVSHTHEREQHVDETVVAAAASLTGQVLGLLARYASLFHIHGGSGDSCLRCGWHNRSDQRAARRVRGAGRDGIIAIRGAHRLRRPYIPVGVDRTFVQERLQ